MATITRRLASRLRAVCRRAYNRGPYPNLSVATSRDGLVIRVRSIDVAVEFRDAAAGPQERLWLPFQCLLDCEAKRDDPVQIEAAGTGRVTAQWQDGNVPQLVQYEAAEPADADKFPSLPERLAPNPGSLLNAFQQAAETTDPGSARYALGCVQMRGKSGTLAATDGRQLFVQSGFTLPWEDDLLVPKTQLLACPEFDAEQAVEVGKAGDWIALRSGPWTVWLAIRTDGRFPDVSRHIPRAADATATCRLSPSDAAFLIQTLPRLPGDQEKNYPVTVDLNGSVAVRAIAQDQTRPTEVVLTNSRWSGEPIRFNTNREYLLRAARFGFPEIHLYGPESPVFCEDEHRKYVWMVLGSDPAIGPAKDAIRIESPADPAGAVPQSTKRRTTVSKSNQPPETASRNGHNHTTEAKPEQATGAIEQAVALRDTLRDATNRATDLIRTLQHDRKQARQLRTALASLREIQKLEI